MTVPFRSQTTPNKVTRTFNDDHVTNEKPYISTFRRPMATNPDREVAFDKRILSTKVK